jgi:alpha-L-fucosidase
MRKTLTMLFSLTVLLNFSISFAQTQKVDPKTIESKMEWFADAKLGIFIHWGIYAVNGIGESWSFHNGGISHKDYMKQLSGFTAENYDPQKWVQLIKQTGARYAVITSKHHDGVALWNTKMNNLSVPKRTPAKRDVLTPFIDELRKNNIHVGLYFSLIDWTYPDYPGFLKDSSRYEIKNNPDRWSKFLTFCHGQLNELITQFNPDLYWFDGDWEHSAQEWQADKIRSTILTHNPNAIINGRLQGYGDYDTPEQNFPVTRPNLRWWELCMTTNDSWGYQGDDTNFKTPYEIITIFADAISMGGNLLLDIGPKADGSIPPEQVYLLEELGKWNTKHSEAIFGTIAGLPQGHFYGPSTLSKDSLSLYLFLPGKETGEIVLKGLDSKIKDVRIVGKDTKLTHKLVGKISWSPIPGLVYIDVPSSVQDDYMTVVKVSLESPLKLYRGKGGLQ